MHVSLDKVAESSLGQNYSLILGHKMELEHLKTMVSAMGCLLLLHWSKSLAGDFQLAEMGNIFKGTIILFPIQVICATHHDLENGRVHLILDSHVKVHLIFPAKLLFHCLFFRPSNKGN